MRRPGLDQALGVLEEMVGVVACQVVVRIESEAAGPGKYLLVEPCPGRVSRSVFAVGAARKQNDALRTVAPKLLQRGQDELLVAPAQSAACRLAKLGPEAARI